jgi:tryptophan halogenase
MDPIKRIVIVGGDIVAPMVAAAIANSLRGQDIRMTLVAGPPETAGSHSSLPEAAAFHRYLNIETRELLRKTNATFKLGTDYTNWPETGHHFVLPYGGVGTGLRLVPFHHYFVKKRMAGDSTPFSSYSLAATAANMGRFTLPSADPKSILSTLSCGLHVDAGQYASLFRDYASHCGVRFVDGDVAEVETRDTDGFIQALMTTGGSHIEGDLFIDCSGDRALLIGDALGQHYADWSEFLPCDSSLTVSVPDVPDLTPLTFVVAKSMGWSRRIPMRERSDYTFYYNSSFLGDAEAEASLRRDLGRATIGRARVRRFTSGRRRRFWFKNCVAIGRSAGFIEPLEISNLHLAQNAVLRLMGLFPERSCDSALAGEYNRIIGLEYDNIRDFISLFYASVNRSDTPFWNHCRSLAKPDSLLYRLDLFKSHGRLAWYEEEVFSKDYWVSALIGLECFPGGYYPLADVPRDAVVDDWLEKIRDSIRDAVEHMPTHEQFILDSLRQ